MKRSAQKIITTKSMILRFMRISKKISQPFAGQVAGCSDAAIGHYENGRMDITDDRLRKLIKAYGYSYDEYLEFLNGKPIPVINLRYECHQLIEQVSQDDKLKTIHAILKTLVA